MVKKNTTKTTTVNLEHKQHVHQVDCKFSDKL